MQPRIDHGETMDPMNLIIAGVGGQGNVLASQIIGRAAVKKGLMITIGETFGLSQRGGPVMSHLRISKTKKYGPLIPPNRAHVIVGLEPLETLRIIKEFANEKTIVIANSRPIHPLNVIAGDADYPDPHWIRNVLENVCGELFWLKATDLALDLGGPIMLNMILLGAFCALPGVPIEISDVKDILKTIFSKSDKLSANFEALTIGRDLVLNYKP